MTEVRKGPGRPRKYADKKSKVQSWRRKQEGRQLDGDVNNSASWRLEQLSEAWGCFITKAVERLALEADEKYSAILLPETESV